MILKVAGAGVAGKLELSLILGSRVEENNTQA